MTSVLGRTLRYLPSVEPSLRLAFIEREVLTAMITSLIFVTECFAVCLFVVTYAAASGFVCTVWAQVFATNTDHHAGSSAVVALGAAEKVLGIVVVGQVAVASVTTVVECSHDYFLIPRLLAG